MSSRMLKIVCAASILLNVFLVAAVVTSLISLKGARPLIGAGAMRIAGAELPAAERRAFRQALKSARQEAHPLVVTDRQARQNAAALLRARVVDEQALAAALAQVRDADFALRARVESGVIGLIAKLPQDDRAKLAESVERRGARRRH